ncbi:hypothetical protein NQ315_014409 [Exocentrus adspersus]|uniref:RNase H type-1 domain-containing protein n=1 Tax=Exocentrus adspersus TaxID=1586481 RepID=A0AAV8VER7_9CUCU|nr:hypothetical protein NQ315_014409 [Exocentrus adspersus]
MNKPRGPVSIPQSRDSLSRNVGPPVRPYTILQIETSVENLTRAVVHAYEQSCPVRKARSRQGVPWWNQELLALRKKARALINRAMRTKTDADWDSYKEAQRKIKSCTKRSKRVAWKEFCESIEDLPAASRIHRVLKKDQDCRINDLRLPDAELGQRNKVRLVWVPGHCGVTGNEEADAIARKGSTDFFTGPEPAVGLPYSYPQSSIDNWTREKCQEDWSRGIGLRQAGLLIKGPGAAATRSLVSLNRANIKIITGLLTGHGRLNKHLNTIGFSLLIVGADCAGQVTRTRYMFFVTVPA